MGNWNCAGGNFDDNHTRTKPRTQYDSTLTVPHQQDEEADSVDESISLPQLQLDTQVQQIGDKEGMS